MAKVSNKTVDLVSQAIIKALTPFEAAQKAGAQVKEQAREQVQDRLKNLFKR